MEWFSFIKSDIEYNSATYKHDYTFRCVVNNNTRDYNDGKVDSFYYMHNVIDKIRKKKPQQ